MSPSTYVCVDVETTGIAPEKNEIIEIGAVLVVNHQISTTFSTLVKPKRKIHPFIASLTGIQNKDVKNARSFEDVSYELQAFIGEHIFVAHNATFDFQIISQSFEEIGQEPLHNACIDTFDLSTILYPSLPSYKLHNLAHELDIDARNSHRAKDDATCLAEIFIRMMADLQQCAPMIIKEAIVLLKNTDLGNFFTQFEDRLKSTKSMDYKQYVRPYRTLKEHMKTSKKKIIHTKSVEHDFNDISRQYPNYEERSTQIDMAELVSQCLQTSQHGVIEAPTGSGKSLAYLVPAVRFSIENNVPLIIGTKTKLLQNQLLLNDLNVLKQSLQWDFSAVLLKGKENYVDIERFDQLYRDVKTKKEETGMIPFLGVLHWIISTETGDLSGLHPLLFQKFSKKLYYNSHKPVGAIQGIKKHCFVTTLRKLVKETTVIVTNHALIMSDWMAEAKLLPEYHHLIIDEAHAFEGSVLAGLTQSVSQQRFYDLMGVLDSKKRKGLADILKERLENTPIAVSTNDYTTILQLLDAIEALKNCGELLFDEIKRVFLKNQINKQTATLIIDENIVTTYEWKKVASCFEDIELEIVHMLSELGHLIKTGFRDKTREAKERCLWIQLASNQLSKFLESCQGLFNNDTSHIVWIHYDRQKKLKQLSIHAAPVSCREAIFEGILKKKKSVIFTSATLSIKQDLSYFLHWNGLDLCTRNIMAHCLPSEFDLNKQVLFGEVSDLPKYAEGNTYYKEIADMVETITAHMNGKTLVLFTSIKAMKGVFYKIKDALRNQNIPVYCQQVHGSRESIIEQFKMNKGKAVILGVDSFWEGVDIPGGFLSCIVIPKLPFLVPTDPIVVARLAHLAAEGEDGFTSLMVPKTILKLKQGIGRLIRTKKDKGLILILDSRLFTKAYGKILRRELAHFQACSGSLTSILDRATLFINE